MPLIALFAWRPVMPRAAERWANPLIGVASGAVAGVTGIAAVPFLPYMQSLQISKNELVQALGILFVFITSRAGRRPRPAGRLRHRQR